MTIPCSFQLFKPSHQKKRANNKEETIGREMGLEPNELHKLILFFFIGKMRVKLSNFIIVHKDLLSGFHKGVAFCH
jgi:hypothetical protein